MKRNASKRVTEPARSAIPKKEMIASLQRSGYLMEGRIVRALSEIDCFAEPNVALIDERTGISREIDMVAEWFGYDPDTKNVAVKTTFILEAINNLFPVVLLTPTASIPISDPTERLRYNVTPPDRENVRHPFPSTIDVLEEHGAFEWEVYAQYCTFSRKKQDQELMASHSDDLHTSIRKAAEYLLYAQYEQSSWMNETEDDRIWRIFQWRAVIVLRHQLFTHADYKRGTAALSKVPHAKLQYNFHYRGEPKTVILDFVTEDMLPNFIQRINATDAGLQRKLHETVNPGKLTLLQGFFNEYPQTNFVTTNYDTLISDSLLGGRARVFVEGSTAPKTATGGNVFHIHGCTTKPESMVLTISDYYRFQHEDNYLSRKFFTLLQETTILILGYSLADFNLNSILNEAQGTRAVSLQKSDIYLASRQSIDPVVKDFYKFTYGVTVLDPYEIGEVFMRLSGVSGQAKGLVGQTQNLAGVLEGQQKWTDVYLKLNSSLSAILLQASVLGISATNMKLQEMLLDILKRKKGFTADYNAWTQYEGLADWLVEIGSLIVVAGTSFQKDYVELVDFSFATMSKDLMVGYSWAAFKVWRDRFQELRMENQHLLKTELNVASFSSRACVTEMLSAA